MKIDYEKINDVLRFWEQFNYTEMMAMEELAECAKSISKLKRKNDEESIKNFIEEVGDVIISLSCIGIKYGVDYNLIEKRIKDKLDKEY